MMRETVRFVSDGEELVLSEGEAFRFAPNTGAQYHALLQDGPEIRHQKPLRELSDAEPQGSDGMAVPESDLPSYREAHTRPVQRAFSS